MAQGDVVVFDEFLNSVGRSEMNLDVDDFRLGIVTATTTPVASTADPGWAVARTTNFLANEVTPGGNYTTGGTTITSTYSQSAGTATFDGVNITWTQNAANPTNARWGILYDFTDADKKAVAFLDLGSVFDMTTGDLVVTWNVSGIFTIA